MMYPSTREPYSTYLPLRILIDLAFSQFKHPTPTPALPTTLPSPTMTFLDR